MKKSGGGFICLIFLKKKKSKINNFIISGFLGLFACMCLICLASFCPENVYVVFDFYFSDF